MYKVYMHITPSGKKYIGITGCSSVKRRWGNGANYRKQIFNRAIKKYGWNNIKHIVLYDNLTEEEAKKKEIELISFFNTTNSKYGYNNTKGGDSRKKPTLETRLKTSKALIGKTKKPFKHQKEVSKYRGGKAVMCIETKVTFPRIKDASEEYEICAETIRLCCHKKRFTAGGYHWKFIKDVEL